MEGVNNVGYKWEARFKDHLVKKACCQCLGEDQKEWGSVEEGMDAFASWDRLCRKERCEILKPERTRREGKEKHGLVQANHRSVEKKKREASRLWVRGLPSQKL